MKNKRIWTAEVHDAEGKVIATASHEVEFKINALNELMDLLDYAYFASAEKPLLSMPTDHEIKITTNTLS